MTPLPSPSRTLLPVLAGVSLVRLLFAHSRGVTGLEVKDLIDQVQFFKATVFRDVQVLGNILKLR